MWTTPASLSSAGQNAFAPQVAVDADGDAVFTWFRSDGTNDRIQARARSAAGVLSPVQTLSAAGRNATDPQVAVDADGDAVFTWERHDGANFRLQAQARSAAGVLSPVQTLSGVGQHATDPQVAVDADGDAVFTWLLADATGDRIQARARSAAGVLSAVQTLSSSGQDALAPQVAVDPDGDAVLAWQRFDGSRYRVQALGRSAAGALSPVQTLSGVGQHAIDAQVAVDPDGDAVLAWRRTNGTNYLVQARARSAAGVLSPVQTLSAAGQHAFAPQVAVDGDGDAVFTWERSDGTDSRIQARGRSAAGALSPLQTLSAAGQDANRPQVDTDANGDAVFTWHRFDGSVFRVQARARSAAGVLSPPQNVSANGLSSSNPQVAMDPGGDAVLAWHAFQGANLRVQASAGP